MYIFWSFLGIPRQKGAEIILQKTATTMRRRAGADKDWATFKLRARGRFRLKQHEGWRGGASDDSSGAFTQFFSLKT